MCTFCSIAKHEIKANIVYETDELISFLDIDPINEGHVLVIPKDHYCDIDEMPQELLFRIAVTSQIIVTTLKKTYNPDGYSIMQNGGIFNDIGHYHLHIFPRYQNDGFRWNCSASKFENSSDIALKIKENIHRIMNR